MVVGKVQMDTAPISNSSTGFSPSQENPTLLIFETWNDSAPHHWLFVANELRSPPMQHPSIHQSGSSRAYRKLLPTPADYRRRGRRPSEEDRP